MKALLIGALAASLAGCSCLSRPVPTAAQAVSTPAALKMDGQNRKSIAGASKQNLRSAQFRRKTNAVARRAKTTTAGNTAPLTSAQVGYKADPVIEKAKAAIAALMENSASAQFQTMRRAVRNFSGESLDTICGHVKGKNASGRGTVAIPFLYIVDHDEAYLVDGRSPAAEIVHRSICE